MLSFSNLTAQTLSASRLGLGFNVGLQKIYSEDYHTGYGGGMEAYARYKISPRFFTNVAFGYGELSDGTLLWDKCTYSTDLITLDVKGAINLLTDVKITPYGYLGLGVFYFSRDNKEKPARTGAFDGSFIIGGGIETRINPTLTLDTYMDYRFTTGDDLNNKHTGNNDGYLCFRVGMTYYFPGFGMSGSGSGVELTDSTPIEEISDEEASDEELDALLEGMDNYNETADAKVTMEEYIRLKSRIDQLNDAIRQKEFEIEDLKAQLALRKDKIAELEENLSKGGGSLASSSNVDLTDFAGSYDQALQNFYSRQYEAGIDYFSMLLESHPTHRLASNCQYWIGECYFGKGDYSMALDAFKQVLAYEESFKKDDALLMMGRCYIFLGDKQNASSMFAQLMSEFPDSEYYEKAQKYANGL